MKAAISRRNSFAVFLLLSAVFLHGPVLSQKWKKEVASFQNDLDHHYQDPETSPLLEEDQAVFQHLEYYPASKAFRVKARIERTADAEPFVMATVSGVKKTFRKFAVLHFSIRGNKAALSVYQFYNPETQSYESDLFLPFKDETSGGESYGGGRYIDLPCPDEHAKTMVLDFNQCYNPYCAYSSGWNCPIPPEENNLSIPIRAGVMAWKGGH